MTTFLQQVDVIDLLDTEPVPLVEVAMDVDESSLARHFGGGDTHDAQDVLEGVIILDEDAAT